MPGQPAVQVKGAKELRRALKDMGDDLSDLKAINLAAAILVADRAKQNAPRRTGKLSASIRAKASKTRGNVIAGSRLVPYAGPIHFGWKRRNIEPQLFLYDARDSERTSVVDLYENEVERLVIRVGRKS